MTRKLLQIFSFIYCICFLQFSLIANYPQYDNVYVNDWAGLLDSSAESQITQQLKTLRANSDVEITFVSIERMSDYPNTQRTIEGFALDLFNQWGVGNAERNDGVLVLVSRFDREMRIATGRGYDATNKNSVAKSIIDNYFIPNFKRDNYQKGILDGMERVAQEFDPNYTSTALGFASKTKQQFNNVGASAWYELRNSGYLKFLFIGIGLVLLNAVRRLVTGWNKHEIPLNHYSSKANYLVDKQPAKFKQKFKNKKTMEASGYIGGYIVWLIIVSFMATFFGFSFWLTAVAFVTVLMTTGYFVSRVLLNRRNEPKACPRCRHLMRRLSESKDDKHLQLPERVEESLKAVDYDVWLCDECQRTKKLRYPYWQSSTTDCEQCNYRTLEIDTNTLVRATTSREGLEEVIEDCKYCDFHNEYENVISKIVESDSDSSSSGGSFGGGSSSGGGASGSW